MNGVRCHGIKAASDVDASDANIIPLSRSETMQEPTVGVPAPTVNPSETQTEIWKPIPGWEGSYEVSSHGRVRSLPRTMRNRWDGQIPVRGRILAFDGATGYYRVSLNDGKTRERALVHRLVARAFLGGEPRQHVNHLDGNKLNNRLENLEWATPRENVLHAWATGLCKARSGEEAGRAKLTNHDVETVMRAVLRGVTQRSIAEVFGVTEANISAIVRGDTFKEVHQKMKESA